MNYELIPYIPPPFSLLAPSCSVLSYSFVHPVGALPRTPDTFLAGPERCPKEGRPTKIPYRSVLAASVDFRNSPLGGAQTA